MQYMKQTLLTLKKCGTSDAKGGSGDTKHHGEQCTAVEASSQSRSTGGRQHESEGSVQRSRRHIRRQRHKLHIPTRSCRLRTLPERGASSV